jgi:hypothetical protein
MVRISACQAGFGATCDFLGSSRSTKARDEHCRDNHWIYSFHLIYLILVCMIKLHRTNIYEEQTHATAGE